MGNPILAPASPPRGAVRRATFAWTAGVGVGLAALCAVAYFAVSQLTKPHPLWATTAASPAVVKAMAARQVALPLADSAKVTERPARSSVTARNDRREADRAGNPDQLRDGDEPGIDLSAKVSGLPPVVAQPPPAEGAEPSPPAARRDSPAGDS